MCTRYLQQKEKTELFFHRISSSYSITHLVLAIALSNVSPPKTDDTAFIYPFPQDQNHGKVNFPVVQSAWGFLQSVCRQKLKYFNINFEPYCSSFICNLYVKSSDFAKGFYYWYTLNILLLLNINV